MESLRGSKGEGLSQNAKYAITAAGFAAAVGVGYYLFRKRSVAKPAAPTAPTGAAPSTSQTQAKTPASPKAASKVSSPKPAASPSSAAPAQPAVDPNSEEAAQEIVGRDFILFSEKEFMLPSPDSFITALKEDGRADSHVLKQADVAVAVAVRRLEGGKTEEGIQGLRKTLDDVKKMGDDIEVVETVAILTFAIAYIFASLERLDDAEESYQAALAKWESVRGDMDKHILVFLRSLGLCKRFRLHQESSNRRKATKAKEIEELFVRAEKVSLQAHGDANSTTLQMMSCQADALLEQKEYEKAEEIYRKVLGMCKKTDKELNRVAAATYDLFKCLRKQTEKRADADKLEQELEDMMNAMYSGDSRKVMYLMVQIATLNRFQKNFDLAETMYRRALRLIEGKAKNESDLGALLNNLGETLRERKQYSEALEVFDRARGLLEKAKGSDDPEVASVLASTGRLKTDAKQFAEAENYYLKSLEILQKAGHPNIVLVMALYGRHLRMVGGRAAEAEQIEANVKHLEEYFGVKVTVQ